MKYYNRRNYSDYRRDLGRAKEFGMPDTEDAFMSSKEFATEYSKHLIEISQRKNTEYSATGVLDTTDLIQLCSWCFAKAWRRLDWKNINKKEGDERKKMIWAYVKKYVVFELNKEIRRYKDGVRTPSRILFPRADQAHLRIEKTAFDAISSTFDQLGLEMKFADHACANDNDYSNDIKIDVLTDILHKYLTPKERIVIEMSWGIDREVLSVNEIADELGMKPSAVSERKVMAEYKMSGFPDDFDFDKYSSRRREELKRADRTSAKFKTELAHVLNLRNMNGETGANFLEWTL